MTELAYIVAPYDALSGSAGASNGAVQLQELCGIRPTASFRRECGPLIPSLVEFEVRRACTLNHIPFIFGGDHSLTFHSVKTIASIMGHITIVHFDAHHDAYPSPILSHYSVFHHIRARLPVEIAPVGYRHDVSTPVSCQLSEPILGPTYVSVDVDYFDPRFVKRVHHGVRCDDANVCSLATFANSLKCIAGPIVGLDVVEWHGDRQNEQEMNFLSQVIDLLQSAAKASPSRP